jgi:murein DD-endopeptidase MepM/ murein hydrolase activator NlpD
MFALRRIIIALPSAILLALTCGAAMAQEPAPDLPFTRSRGVTGAISGSLEEAALEAGVPAKAVAEAVSGFAEVLDLDRDVHDGDRFYIRFEQTFSLDDTPLDGGRVVWAELQLGAKKKTVALHRFRPSGVTHDSLWLANGQEAAATKLRFPLEGYVVSSGFGLRVDPFDQLPMLSLSGGSAGWAPRGKGPARAALPPALGSGAGGASLSSLNVATPLGMSLGLAPSAASVAHVPGMRGAMALHEGVDLVAPYGARIFAAGDGIVKGAEPKGRYGNWIEIDHPGDLATVYGHLSAFAPGISAGMPVTQGQLIGYIGLTGRTTGPHVHFEVRFKGRPVNPMVYSALKHAQLRGADLDRLRKLAASNVAERESETRAASAGF